jgi:hypothetical protein
MVCPGLSGWTERKLTPCGLQLHTRTATIGAFREENGKQVSSALASRRGARRLSSAFSRTAMGPSFHGGEAKARHVSGITE